MSGLEEIVGKIIKDARNKANSTSEEASINASETLDVANKDANIYIEKHMQESYAERDEIIRRKISLANLEVRKMLLSVKQEILSESFKNAVKEIKLNTAKYKKLIASMLEKAEDGDVVIISREDKDIITPDFVKEILKKLDKKVDVSKNLGVFQGGIILKGIEADKNMSLEVELAAIRDEYEPEIVDILFSSGEEA